MKEESLLALRSLMLLALMLSCPTLGLAEVLGDFDGNGQSDYTVIRSYVPCDDYNDRGPECGLYSRVVRYSWITLSSGKKHVSLESLDIDSPWGGHSPVLRDPTVAADLDHDGRADRLLAYFHLTNRVPIPSLYALSSRYGELAVLKKISNCCSPDFRYLGDTGAGYSDRGPIITFADFDGDGDDDPGLFACVYTSSGKQCVWALDQVEIYDGSNLWGLPFDYPVPGDYSGDGKAELAVWREQTGEWWIRDRVGGVERREQWGLPGDHPMPADYDGDGLLDLAVWRPSEANWYLLFSSTSYSRAFSQQIQFGFPRARGIAFHDIPITGDWDGDGKADIAIYRIFYNDNIGAFYIRRSSDFRVDIIPWGVGGDVPLGMGIRDRIAYFYTGSPV